MAPVYDKDGNISVKLTARDRQVLAAARPIFKQVEFYLRDNEDATGRDAGFAEELCGKLLERPAAAKPSEEE